MATMHEVEVWVCVDENGDYAVGTTDGAAGENYVTEIGESNNARRYVKITVKVPLPETIELTGEVNVTEEPAELKVA